MLKHTTAMVMTLALAACSEGYEPEVIKAYCRACDTTEGQFAHDDDGEHAQRGAGSSMCPAR